MIRGELAALRELERTLRGRKKLRARIDNAHPDPYTDGMRVNTEHERGLLAIADDEIAHQLRQLERLRRAK